MAKSLHKTVFVGMSGGVDSSVAAHLLHKNRYNTIGVFMRCYNVDGCAERDSEDARRVAEKIGIPFYVWDFEEEYKRLVVRYMIRGYRSGLTPNPDVMCNREIKFGLFLKKALSMGADYVATGHYVKLGHSLEVIGDRNKKGDITLLTAKDVNKDQSYFLWTLTAENLRHCLFPIGEYTKPEVRAIARRAGLPTAEKKDSQGICFLGQVSIGEFLSEYIPERPGKLITPEGLEIGEHRGAHFYTVGQRHLGDIKHGNRISSIKYGASSIKDGNTNQKPRYVAAKDIKNNTVIVAEGRDNPLLFKKEVSLSEVNFISAPPPKKGVPLAVLARVRYRQPLFPATLYFSGNSGRSRIRNCRLVFDTPQEFVAKGQSAVWYSRKGEMLGGGVIIATK